MGINDKAWKIGFKWTRGDASNPTGALAVDGTSRAAHFCEAADVATDWNVAAATHPTWYIHSATTPATDYISMYHDATNGYLNIAGGNLALQIAGATVASMTSAGLSFPANTDLTFAGTTGTNDIVLTNGLADALSVTDGSADVLVIDTSTAGNVLTVSGAILATNASLVATTGRIGKFIGTIAAANLGDGYGAHEVDLTCSGTLAGHVAASSSWIELLTGTSSGGGIIITPHNDGIYEESAYTLTAGTSLVFGSRMQLILGEAPTSCAVSPWNINANQAITALIQVNNLANMGYTAGAHSSAVTGSIAFMCNEGGASIKYIRIYDTAA